MFQKTKVNSMYNMDRNHYFDDRNLNREQRRALEKAKRMLIATYPETLEKVPENDPNLPYTSHPQDLDSIWRSKKYTVMVWNVPAGKKMTISRNEWDSHTGRYKDSILWDEIMEIKRQIGFGEQNAIEFYPPDSEVINIANVRHIWLLPKSITDSMLSFDNKELVEKYLKGV